MSKNKKVICIEKPPFACYVRNITVGKEYEILEEGNGSYYIKDDNNGLWWYFQSYFEKVKKKKPKKQKGLTNREYFAAKAMQGLLAGAFRGNNIGRDSVFYADQTIKELNKKKVNEQHNRSGRHCGSH